MKKLLKKALAISVAAILVLSFNACSDKTDSTGDVKKETAAASDAAVKSDVTQQMEDVGKEDVKVEDDIPQKEDTKTPAVSEQAPTQSTVSEPTEKPQESALQADTQPAEEPAAAPTAADAMAFIGQNPANLAAKIGQPNSKSYATSCIGDGQDGEWYYNGFTVYTYRDTNGLETITDVF